MSLSGTHLQFDDNRLLPLLFGEHDENLVRLERMLGVTLVLRGNVVTITGPEDQARIAQSALRRLYGRLRQGQVAIEPAEIDAEVRLAGAEGLDDDAGEAVIRTRKRVIRPRSPGQLAYVNALSESEMVFGLGPAGTGKTYLAVAMAIARMLAGDVERIVLSRPAVEAGERLGFLPGDMKEKVDPYLRPLYDALYDMLPGDLVNKKLESGDIEVAPLAFMRGRTLSNAYVILDEAQNTTTVQMKMFLTRLGENSRMVITGDPSQIDLPRGTRSGLVEAMEVLKGIDEVAFVRFSRADVVRHALVTRIVHAYDKHDRLTRKAAGD